MGYAEQTTALRIDLLFVHHIGSRSLSEDAYLYQSRFRGEEQLVLYDTCNSLVNTQPSLKNTQTPCLRSLKSFQSINR